MRRIPFVSVFLLLAAGVLAGQTTRTVQAVGNATIAATPDQLQLDIGVVTFATTAQDAEQQNASVATTVQNALKAALGASGTLQTVSYSVSPRYSTAQGQTSTIVGYTVTNTVRVTSTNISIAGRIIDAANQAGANSVGNLSFGLQDSDPVVQRALAQAAKQALGHANAIASGLGLKTGAVIMATQGSSYSPVAVASASLGATSTPVQSGTVNVYGSVTVNVALADQ